MSKLELGHYSPKVLIAMERLDAVTSSPPWSMGRLRIRLRSLTQVSDNFPIYIAKS